MIRAGISSFATVSRRLRDSTRGAVALIGALSLTTLIGMGAFAVEATQGYAAKVSNQRIADMAALAGALAFNASSDQTVMQRTAEAVVKASGLAATTVATVLITDSLGNNVVKSTVTTQVPLALGKILSGSISYDVVSAGMASTSATVSATPPCIAALSGAGTYGITLSGGTLIDAPNCAINTNSGVTVPNGTRINAKQLSAGKAINNGSPGIVTSPTAGNFAVKSNPASDWMLASDPLKQALCKVNKLVPQSDSDYADGNTACINQLVTPSAISPVSGSAQNYTTGYRDRANGGYDAYQTANYSCKYVFPAGDYEFGDFVVGGGCDVTFQNGNLKFRSLDMSGGTMIVGSGNFTVVGEFKVNADNPIVIGNGAHSFGSLKILGGKKLDLGSGNFYVTGGISVSGGAYLKAAIGVGQTVTIGPINPTSGNSITISGGSQICFTADCTVATAAAGLFSANSSIVNDGGGSLIVFPKSETHIVNGNLALSSGAIFSPGLYVVKGNFTNGTGDPMRGTDISFVLGGTVAFSGGTTLNLAAPGSSSTYGIANVLLASKTTAATKIGGGANGKYSGLIYLPKSDLVIDGGASASSGSACMMLIVNTLTLNGGTSASSSCTGISSGASSVAKVALIQ